jgi:hypothetical protein
MTNVVDCFLHWHVTPNTESELATADAVATHEFSDQHLVSGTTEKIIGRALEYVCKYNKPLMCQYPGNQVAEQKGILPVHTVREHLLHSTRYLETEEVNRQFALECHRRGWHTVILITHPHHMWRAGKNLALHRVKVLYAPTKDIPYDPLNPRKVLSSPMQYIPYEIGARQLRYLPRGWI